MTRDISALQNVRICLRNKRLTSAFISDLDKLSEREARQYITRNLNHI